MKKLAVLSLLAFLILLQLARADITTDKETYKPGETIDIRLSSANSLTEVALYIINSRGTQEVSQTSIVNNQVWEYNYTLGADAINGTYVINIIASEGGSLSENSTKFYFSKNFDVTTPSDFSANPDVISETVSEITENTIELENSGDSDVNISEIIVLEDLIGVVSIVQRPYVIPPNSKSIVKIRIDPSNLPQGSYKGTISILSNKGVILVHVNLQVIPSTKTGLKVNIEDYSFIIWTFATFIVVVIVTITILRYRKIRKKKSQEKKKIDEEKKKEDTYYKSQEEYRTEYY